MVVTSVFIGMPVIMVQAINQLDMQPNAHCFCNKLVPVTTL